MRLSPLVVILILLMLFSVSAIGGSLAPDVGHAGQYHMDSRPDGIHDPAYQLSAILPAVFTSVGCHGIHVLHRYRGELSQSETTRCALNVWFGRSACGLYGGATTAAGFVSNAFSSIIRIREFGLFTALAYWSLWLSPQ